MDETRARHLLDLGLVRISDKQVAWKLRQRYYDGDQDLPYAPEGVSAEYHELRKQAKANWLQLVMDAPIQRLRAEGFRTGRDGEADHTAWTQVWQANKLDSRQRIPYRDMMVHGRGLMSVWPNAKDVARPIIRPEKGSRVHLEPDPDDPWTTAWAVKTFTIDDGPPSGLVLPNGSPVTRTREVGIVYDDETWHRFERGAGVAATSNRGGWVWVKGDRHDMGEVPFVAYDHRPDADGVPRSAIEPLIAAQDAINTIRFLVLLAMQFSGYRQRIVSAFDPVIRDSQGMPIWQLGDDGTPKTDARGNKIPEVMTPGRVGVDRLLAFPGKDTKVFDLPESNLENYIKVLGEFLQDLFATAQTPPQYLLNRMANVSGDALSAAESTLQSLVVDLQLGAGESHEQVMRLGNRARGEDNEDVASEVIWADAEAKSFAQVIDGVQKLVTSGFPKQGAWEMLPGATPPKVKRWLAMAEQEAEKAAARDPATALKDAANAFRPGEPASTTPPATDDEGEPRVPDGTPTVPGLPTTRTNGVKATATR